MQYSFFVKNIRKAGNSFEITVPKTLVTSGMLTTREPYKVSIESLISKKEGEGNDGDKATD